MLDIEEIVRIKEIADIIKQSSQSEELVGSCVTDENFDDEKEEQKPDPITSEENIVLYSLALKRFVIEKHSELNENEINVYVKKYGGKQRTRLRAAMNSARFKEVYESCYAKNIQDTGVDAIFPIPMPKEECQLTFLQFLNVFYDSFVKSHSEFKNKMIKIARAYYKQEKAKRIQVQLESIDEFLRYYIHNPDIFTEENLANTLNEAGQKYGPNFMSDIHPILFVFSDLLVNKLEGVLMKQMDIVEDWLNIKYDDKDTSGKIQRLFITMFYSKSPLKKDLVTKIADNYLKSLTDLMDTEKKNKENVRKELLEESIKIKESRKKDDMKLNLRKRLQKK